MLGGKVVIPLEIHEWSPEIPTDGKSRGVPFGLVERS